MTTLEKHSESIESKRRKSRTSLQKSNLGILRRQLAGLEEDFADDEMYEDTTSSVLDITSRLFSELKAEEKQAFRTNAGLGRNRRKKSRF